MKNIPQHFPFLKIIYFYTVLILTIIFLVAGLVLYFKTDITFLLLNVCHTTCNLFSLIGYRVKLFVSANQRLFLKFKIIFRKKETQNKVNFLKKVKQLKKIQKQTIRKYIVTQLEAHLVGLEFLYWHHFHMALQWSYLCFGF